MQIMTRSITLAAVACSLAVGTAHAQDSHPNFSGIWVMDSTKTVVRGQFSAPTSATTTMRQQGDTITQDREGSYSGSNIVKSHAVWGLDGKVWKNKVVANGAETEVASVLSWDKGARSEERV